ncbi:MAG: sigma factor-like helix-turn-helix DNA-binding protein [Pseudonocardiaceae bacterium]
MRDPACVEFEMLVMYLQKRGFERALAQDAASEAVSRACQRRLRIDQSLRGWLRTVGYRIACNQARRAREELLRALAGGWLISAQCDVDVVETLEEEDRLLRLLQQLPRQQRRVMQRHLDGFGTKDIADQLNMQEATARSHLRHGRKTLRGLVGANEQELHFRAGERLWEAFQNGDPLPAIPRPVILTGWNLARDLNVPPECGRQVEPLGRDEVRRRRHNSPLIACSAVLHALTELGDATNQMMVVVDSDGVVLWRGGTRRVLRLADDVGFIEGALWDLEHAGVNGIALALTTKQTVTVCKWEHYVQAQHGLSCVAAPVRSASNGRVLCVLNLTGTEPAINPAIRREIDTMAIRLYLHTRAFPG